MQRNRIPFNVGPVFASLQAAHYGNTVLSGDVSPLVQSAKFLFVGGGCEPRPLFSMAATDLEKEFELWFSFKIILLNLERLFGKVSRVLLF